MECKGGRELYTIKQKVKNINIEFTRLFLYVIGFYLLISFILFLFFLTRIITFIPLLYHILHAILIGFAMFAACYKEIVAEEKVKIFITISLVLFSVLFALAGTEGILKFSTIFLDKRKALLKCVQVIGTEYRTKNHLSYDAHIKMSNYWGIPSVYPITQEEKSFIDTHIDSCVCIELLFYESPLGFPYTEFGNSKGTIKVCDENNSSL